MYVGVGCERKSAKKIARSGLRPLENAKRWLEVAFDLMRVVHSGPECEMCRDYYYLSTGGAHRVVVGTQRRCDRTKDPRVRSAFV